MILVCFPLKCSSISRQAIYAIAHYQPNQPYISRYFLRPSNIMWMFAQQLTFNQLNNTPLWAITSLASSLFLILILPRPFRSCLHPAFCPGIPSSSTIDSSWPAGTIYLHNFQALLYIVGRKQCPGNIMLLMVDNLRLTIGIRSVFDWSLLFS